MAEANVVVRVDYSQLQGAINSAEALKNDLSELAKEKVSLAGDFRDALTEAERLRSVVRDLNNAIKASEKTSGRASADQYAKQAVEVEKLAKAEERLRNIRADQRVNQSLIDIGKQDLAAAKEIVQQREAEVRAQEQLIASRKNASIEAESLARKTMTSEVRMAEATTRARIKAAEDEASARAKADAAEAKALAVRQANALKVEQNFADIRRREIEAARVSAIDSGRSTPQTFEEYVVAREKQKAAAEAAAKAEQEATKAMHDTVQQRINEERRDNAQIRAAAEERQKIAEETAKKEAEAIKAAAEEAHKARMDMYAEQYRLQDLERRQDDFNQAQKREEEVEQLERQAEAAEHLRSVLQGVSSVMNAGASVSNFLGDFSQGIGNSFSGMASLFGNNQVSTALTRFVTYNALRGITGNLSNTIQRYDIMSTFLPYMAVAGVGEEQAQLALDRVNQAILGLPIGLDESAQRLRRYQMFLGDIDSATNLTIGAQNAILAGGASPQMQTQAYYQIDRLLSAGRLSTSRQWLSLIQGMGVSMRFVSEAMGTTGMNAKELAAGLTSGAISTESFLNALMELGKGESDAAQGLEATLEIYKGTIEAWINNIQFAATRGGENVMKALNGTLVEATGQGITGYLKDYRDFLNTVFGKADEGGGISGWIKDNPQAIVDVMESGYQVIAALERFSASGIGTSILENTSTLFESIATALNTIPSGKLEEFVGFATTLAGPLGAAFGASSGLGQMLGVFERFKDFPWETFISELSEAVGLMSNLVSGVLGLVSDETMSKILSYGLVFGKPVGNILSTGAGAVSSLASLSLLRKIANGGAAGAATGGGMDFLVSAFEGGATGGGLATAGSFLAALAPLLAAGGFISYANSRFASTEYDTLLKDSNTLYNVISSRTFLTRDRAHEAQTALTNNIQALSDEYTSQSEYLQRLYEQMNAQQPRYEELRDKYLSGGILTQQETEEYSKLSTAVAITGTEIELTKDKMAALNDLMVKEGTLVGQLTIKYGDYEIVLGDTGNLYEVSEQKVSAYTEHIRNLAAAFSEVAKNAAEAAKESLSGFSGIELPDTPKGGYTQQNIEGMESQINAGEQVLKSASTIKQYIDDLEASGFNKNGENFIGYLQEILNLEDFGEKTKQLNELADLLSTGGDLQTALDTFGKREDLKGQVDAIFKDLGTSVSTFASDSEKARTSLEKMVESAKELSSSDINIGAFKESLMGFGDEEMQTAATNLSDAATHIATLKEQLMGFAEETPGNVEEATGSVSTDMGDMATSVDGSSQTTVTAVQNIDSAFATSTAPADAANVSNGIASGLEQGLSRIQNASTAIQNQIALLNGLSATVTINTVTNTVSGVRADGSDITPTSVGAATGGPVFKAFGSDTVPYMLTPGEYIIRKGAADFFGRGLLERINALDIGGAFDRLILNSPVTAGRFGGNVYNKDNHASVVQNYYNSSPDYGNRRAWRFAHSL